MANGANRIYFKKDRNAVKAVIATALAALLALLIAAVCYRSAPTVTAESGCTVTIHVYDPAQEYDTLAGWVWTVGGTSAEWKMSATARPNEQFKKDGNAAHTIDITFDTATAAKLKSGTKLGFLVVIKKSDSGDWNTKYDKENLPDIMMDLSAAFDENNHADVYFVRKDTEAYTDLEEAIMAFEKITSAKFSSKTQIYFEASSKLESDMPVTLYDGETSVATGKTTVGTNKFAAEVKLSKFAFDFSADYMMQVGKFKQAFVSKSALIDDPDFIRTFESADAQNIEYGAIVDKQKGETTFRVWAPLASAVALNLYDSGWANESSGKVALKKRMVSGKWGGVWEVTFPYDYSGKYYTYSVTNSGNEVETIDPYAKACGANGVRGMVIDFDKANPDGWENDKHIYDIDAVAADTPIVWEVHVRDFSISPDSGMLYKGKYLAFTEQNTTVPGKSNLKTGINYLKDLGITYVHLNPVYDFATIDESEPSIADNTKDNFNWGYDPQNYNIPEGSYSTDPSRGEVRINEFKQMVMALHEAGIGVIMDVVYNHTYQTQGQALHNTVPYYYHRLNDKGGLADGTGCGNETASERSMYRKYIVESVLHWANEYHIDGFRFDLMGIHDKITLAAVRDALDATDGGKGKSLLMYGEPWAGFGYQTPASYTQRVSATQTEISGAGKYSSNANNKLMAYMYYDDQITELPARVAIFNDSGRDSLRGNLWDGQPGQGWVNGSPGSVGGVKKMIEGGAGGTGSGKHMGLGSRNVAYAAAHDNYTLWDQLVGKKHGTETPLFYDDPVADRIKQCKLVSAAYLMSSGIPFMLAGDEIGRTKYGNENSYKSPQKLNYINWSRQEAFAELYNHFKALIKARKDNSAELFSYMRASETAGFSTGSFTGSNDGIGRIVFNRGALALDLNASTLSGTVKIGGKTITAI